MFIEKKKKEDLRPLYFELEKKTHYHFSMYESSKCWQVHGTKLMWRCDWA